MSTRNRPSEMHSVRQDLRMSASNVRASRFTNYRRISAPIVNMSCNEGKKGNLNESSSLPNKIFSKALPGTG